MATASLRKAEVFVHPTYGRAVRATEAIPAGAVVLKERPFFALIPSAAITAEAAPVHLRRDSAFARLHTHETQPHAAQRMCACADATARRRAGGGGAGLHAERSRAHACVLRRAGASARAHHAALRRRRAGAVAQGGVGLRYVPVRARCVQRTRVRDNKRKSASHASEGFARRRLPSA
jgi:hypothetical protein